MSAEANSLIHGDAVGTRIPSLDRFAPLTHKLIASDLINVSDEGAAS
jgi:hypothetical protein